MNDKLARPDHSDQILLLRQGLSRTDQAIVAKLQEDGRRPYVNIAREIGVTEKTVRNRVKHLVSSQIIQIVAVTSPPALGYHAGGLIGVVTDARHRISAIAEALAAIAAVDYVVVTAGRFSLLVEVLARDLGSLSRIVEAEVGQVEGIVSLETFPYFSVCYQQARFSTFPGEREADRAVRAREMDPADKRIVSLLSVDGRMPVNEIAEKLGVSETQVRNRIRSLVDSELMSVMAIINPMSLRFEAISWVAINVAAGHGIRRLADDLTRVENVSYVVICAGRFDIFVEVVCASNEVLLDVVDEAIRPLPGVEKVETFLYLDLHYKRLLPVSADG